MRDALIWLGEADPCETMERVRAEDPQLEKLHSVLHQWRERIGERRVSAAEAVQIAERQNFDCPPGERSGFQDALFAVAGNGRTLDVRRLGNWLKLNKDRIVDGMKIVPAGFLTGSTQWQLVKVERKTEQHNS